MQARLQEANRRSLHTWKPGSRFAFSAVTSTRKYTNRVYVTQRARKVGTVIVFQAFSELDEEILSFKAMEFKEEMRLFAEKVSTCCFSRSSLT